MPVIIPLGTVKSNNGINYKVSFLPGKELPSFNGIKPPDIRYIQRKITESNLDPANIERITAKGIQLRKGEISDPEIHRSFTCVFPDLEPTTSPHPQTTLPQEFKKINSSDPIFSSPERSTEKTLEIISKIQLIQEQLTQQRGEKSLSAKATQTTHLGLELSTLPTSDFQHNSPDNPIFEPFGDITTRHLLLKNSALNGRYFINEAGEFEQVHDAVTSSFDRLGQKLALGRRIEMGDGSIIAYAGRPDTKEKAIELIKMTFLSEWKQADFNVNPLKADEERRGISFFKKRENIYDFTFLVNSLLSTNLPFAEKRLTREIYSVLKEMEKTPITMEIGGQEITIIPKPLFITQQLNWANRIEDFLSDDTSGKELAKQLSKRGIRQLLTKADHYNKQNTVLEENKTRITYAQQILMHDSENLRPEELLFYRFYLCNLLNIPIVTHCKSSVDRTGVALALESAIKQWEKAELRNDFPEELAINRVNPHLIMQTDEFKELFAHNLLGSLPITKIARGQYGYKLNHGILQNPVVLRLLPKRFLTDYKISKITKYMKNNHVGKHLRRLLAFLIGGIALTTIFSNQSVSSECHQWIHRSSGLQKIMKRIALGSAVTVSFIVYRVALPIIIFALGTAFDLIKSALFLDLKRLITLKWLKTNIINSLKTAVNIGMLIPEKQIKTRQFNINKTMLWDHDSQQRCNERKREIYPIK